MEYNDEKLLSMDEYAVMAKAYSQALKKKGFIFVQINEIIDTQLVDEIFDVISKIRSCLLYLGGFLGTGKLFQANERHTESLKILLDYNAKTPAHRIRGDKTKCFLEFLSLENKLISLFITLSKECPFSKQIERIIMERLSICYDIFQINGIIFPTYKN